MANENVKTLQTRIALKYDEYANWLDDNTPGKGANLVLLKGEIGLCAVPDEIQDGRPSPATNNPTVLFKVGDGVTPFSELKWASALAADVYSWAKASDVVLEGKTIKFVGTNKVITLDYITEEEVKTKITNELGARLATLEANVGTTTNIGATVDALAAAVEVINGEGAGSINKAAADTLAAAKAYADTAETDAVATAKAYTDAELVKAGGRMDSLASDITNNAADISTVASNLTTEQTDRKNADAAIEAAYKAADQAIDAKIGGNFTSTDTVDAAIKAAKKTGEDAAAAVDALAAGAVATNTTNITENAANIATVSAGLTAETTAREAADSALSERLATVENFFNAKGEEEGYDGLGKALDTLVEIQEYITTEGEAADEMLTKIGENTAAIELLQSADETMGTRVGEVEATVATATSNISAISATIAGYSANNTVSAAIAAVSAIANQGVTDAATAQAAAEAAQTDVDNLTTVVDDNTEAIEAVTNTATNNAAAIASIQSDYLRQADIFVFNCGSSTEVIH